MNPTTPAPKKDDKPPASFLGLPFEILAKIIEILVEDAEEQWPRQAPTLTPEFIRSRVPVANDFDPTKPTVTNIYVDRLWPLQCDTSSLAYTSERLHGIVESTLEHIRVARKETAQKAASGGGGAVEKPRGAPARVMRGWLTEEHPAHVMDVMLVKDVGLFPTWLTPPPERDGESARDVTVRIRIVQPKKGIVPPAWIEAGQHHADEDEDRARWSVMTVLALLAPGSLRLRVPDGAAPWPGRCFHATAQRRPDYDVRVLKFHFPEPEYGADGKVAGSSDTGCAFDPPAHRAGVVVPFARTLLAEEGPFVTTLPTSRSLYGDVTDTVRDMTQMYAVRGGRDQDPHVSRLAGVMEVLVRYGEQFEGCLAGAGATIGAPGMVDPALSNWQPRREYRREDTAVFGCCGRKRLGGEATPAE